MRRILQLIANQPHFPHIPSRAIGPDPFQLNSIISLPSEVIILECYTIQRLHLSTIKVSTTFHSQSCLLSFYTSYYPCNNPIHYRSLTSPFSQKVTVNVFGYSIDTVIAVGRIRTCVSSL